MEAHGHLQVVYKVVAESCQESQDDTDLQTVAGVVAVAETRAAGLVLGGSSSVGRGTNEEISNYRATDS